jgi:hypothetical protein
MPRFGGATDFMFCVCVCVCVCVGSSLLAFASRTGVSGSGVESNSLSCAFDHSPAMQLYKISVYGARPMQTDSHFAHRRGLVCLVMARRAIACLAPLTTARRCNFTTSVCMELDQCKPIPILRIVEAMACLNAKAPFCRFGCRAEQKKKKISTQMI